MKPKRKRDFTGMFIMAVLLSFILPLGYLVVRIVSYGGGTEEVRSREDYVLMLLQCLLGIAARSSSARCEAFTTPYRSGTRFCTR